MPLVSVTRLRLRKMRFLPGFVYYAVRSMMQSKKAEGNLHASAERQARVVFWTITVWEDERSMRHFRNSGPHRRVMPKLANWCDEATFVHWVQDTSEPPSLSRAHARLIAEGTVSRVSYPSPAHATRAFPPPPAPS